MAQVTQIIPKFAFPHVETVINDYTEVSPDVVVAEAPYVNYVFPFTSSQGIDNVFVRKRSVESFKQTYGDSNYKKYRTTVKAYEFGWWKEGYLDYDGRAETEKRNGSR